jgi:hypothetical protein
MFVGKARSLPRAEHLKDSSLGLAQALLANIRLGRKSFQAGLPDGICPYQNLQFLVYFERPCHRGMEILEMG